MKSRSALTALTLVNLEMLIFVLIHQAVPVQADSPDQVLRARALRSWMRKEKYEHPSR